LGVRESIPPADVAVKLARVLNTSVEWLVEGAEDDRPDTGKVRNRALEAALLSVAREIDEKELGALLCLAHYYRR
jgi:hypothetical protein